MDLFDVAKSCAKRWYVFLPLVAVFMWYAYSSYSSVAPVYYGSTTIGQAGASVREVSPNQTEVRANVIMESGGGHLLTNLLALGLQDGTARQHVAEQGGDPNYVAEVFTVPGGQLPLVVLSATTPDPALTSKTLEAGMTHAATVLRNVQLNAGVPEDQLIRTYPVVPPGAPIEAMPSRMKSAVMLGAAGFGTAVLAAVIVDLLLLRRKQSPKTAVSAQESNPAPASSANGHGRSPLLASQDSDRR